MLNASVIHKSVSCWSYCLINQIPYFNTEHHVVLLMYNHAFKTVRHQLPSGHKCGSYHQQFFLKEYDGRGRADWMDLAKDMNRWRALVNAVMNLRVPYNAGNFLTGRRIFRCWRNTLIRGVCWKRCYFSAPVGMSTVHTLSHIRSF
jgi:hypothetical protein